MTNVAFEDLYPRWTNGNTVPDDERLASTEYAKPLQHPEELAQLIALFKRAGVSSLLEVGSRYGGTLERVLMECPEMRAVVVDFPGHHFGDQNSGPILYATTERLKANGRRVEDVIMGPSSASEVVARVETHAPYDAVFLDADHSYQAVRRDFFNYGRMAARMIVIHDIAAPPGTRSRNGRAVEVPRFWEELKADYRRHPLSWYGIRRHEEYVVKGSLMGIGVLFF